MPRHLDRSSHWGRTIGRVGFALAVGLMAVLTGLLLGD